MHFPQPNTAGSTANNPTQHPAIELVELSLSKYAASQEESLCRDTNKSSYILESRPQSPTRQSSYMPASKKSSHNTTGLLCLPAAHNPGGDSNLTDPQGTDSTQSRTESQSTHSQRSTLGERLQKVWFHWSSAYRLIIAFTLVVNSSPLAYTILHHRSPSDFLLATSTNLLVAVLIRQEDLINATFKFVAKTPCTWPLGLRKAIADLHHYGGLHIGCAVSALIWYIVFVADSTVSIIHHRSSSTMTPWLWGSIVTSYTFLVCLLVVCITAHPRLRGKFHNTFEHTHRFGGWLALLVLWINSGVASRLPDHIVPLYKSAPLWLLAMTTFLIVLPWLRIRRVPISAEVVSAREVKLTFPYPNMSYTSTVKFSRSPLNEWHAFATIPSPDATSATIVISQAGDWTKRIINAPPPTLWMRDPPTQNFLALTPLFKSLLLVATGAGIGPVLSLLTSPSIRHMRAQGRLVKVMWTVYAPEAEHWRFVQDIIRAVDAHPLIYDSRRARPDIPFETTYLMRTRGIEAVMVVSNKAVTQAVVCGVKAWGGCAYGAVFDS
ncbi:hypothetical protein J1614_001548 [Plenodomus biglobosus]|nr:hypothetical protein J1614_001548 [Plenodomus biglobosus]